MNWQHAKFLLSSVHIHNDDYDTKSWFACKGVPSSKHFDLSSIFGFKGLKAEVNPCYKATSLFWIVGFKVWWISRWKVPAEGLLRAQPMNSLLQSPLAPLFPEKLRDLLGWSWGGVTEEEGSPHMSHNCGAVYTAHAASYVTSDT